MSVIVTTKDAWIFWLRLSGLTFINLMVILILALVIKFAVFGMFPMKNIYLILASVFSVLFVAGYLQVLAIRTTLQSFLNKKMKAT